MRSFLLTCIAGISMLLAGCSEEAMQFASPVSGSSAGKTPEERQLEQEVRNLNKVSKDIIVRNTVEGALIGAAAGCGIALLLGGDGGDCAAGAAVGGVFGGASGNAVGQKAAAKNKEIVNSKAIVANLRNVSTGLNSVEVNLRAVLRSQDAEIRSLKRQLDGAQISQSAYDARVRAIKSNRRAVASGLQNSEQNMSNTITELNAAASKGQPGLSTARQAAASNKQRLARTRASINLL